MIERFRSVTRRLWRALAGRLDAARARIAAGDGNESSQEHGSELNQAETTSQVERVDGSGPAADADSTDADRVDFSWLPPAADSSQDVRPADIGSQSEIVQRLGVTPTEFVLALLEHHDGRLEQQAFTAYTALSESSLSRLLGDLETNDLVQRFQIGSRKVVCLPENTPRRDVGHVVQDASGEPGRTPTA